MSIEFYITIAIEILLTLFVVYGILHEDQFIHFEDIIKRLIRIKYKRFKRKSRHYLIQAYKAIRYNYFYRKWQRCSTKLDKYHKLYDEYTGKLMRYRYFRSKYRGE